MKNKKAKTYPEYDNDELVDSFLKNGHIFFKETNTSIPEIFFKSIPPTIRSTTIMIRYSGYALAFDVSRIKSIHEDSSVISIDFKNDPSSTPLYVPKSQLDFKNMITISKRLERFDILLQIEG